MRARQCRNVRSASPLGSCSWGVRVLYAGMARATDGERTTSQGSAERGLLDYLRILWRHKLLIALTVIVTTGAAVGLDHVRHSHLPGDRRGPLHRPGRLGSLLDVRPLTRRTSPQTSSSSGAPRCRRQSPRCSTRPHRRSRRPRSVPPMSPRSPCGRRAQTSRQRRQTRTPAPTSRSQPRTTSIRSSPPRSRSRRRYIAQQSRINTILADSR